MKIQELIPSEKIYTIKYMNQIERNYQKKKGYYWKIPSHSQNESVLLHNYEKDCVIAYIKNKYILVFLIKIKGGFKGFAYTGKFLQSIKGGYIIEGFYSKKDILKAFNEDEENLKIVDNKEYKKFIKLLILDGIEN